MEEQLVTNNEIAKEDTYYGGLFLLLLSTLVFFLSDYFQSWELVNDIASDIFSGSFFVCYVIFLIYLIVVFGNNKDKTGRYFKFFDLKSNIFLLLLGNISAYSLNRSIPVFQESTPWLCFYLVLLNIALLFFVFNPSREKGVANYVLVTIMSSAILFNFYQALYIAPYYGIMGVSFWFFGISLHVLIPLWFMVTSYKVVKKYWTADFSFRYPIIIGWTIPFIFIALFSVQWYGINRQLSIAYHDSNSPFNNQELPLWVEVSKNIPDGWMTQKVLKSGLVYTVANFDNFHWFPNGNSFNEKKKHDPLVVTGSFFSGRLKMNNNEKIKLLETMYKERHKTERRLWRGDDLYTKDIVTNIQLIPEYRLAYTEKTFTIENRSKRRWRSQQEALYSFYLPEGSVVTSASLWVNGKEEKSYLTTRGKADSAYQAIVGVERRDPLLLHWQEGNRISVRVFPCTRFEDRKFKIGVTTPLKKSRTELQYQNIDFEGPYWKDAEESVHIVSDGIIEDFDASIGLKRRNGEWHYQGNYRSDWKLNFDAPEISQEAFFFNGRNFKMQNYDAKSVPFEAKEVYLDLHRGWTGRDIRRVWNLMKNKGLDVFVYTNKMERLTDNNYNRLVGELSFANFNLFPFHKIKNPDQALVITQDSKLTPNLNDIKKTKFAKDLEAFLIQQENRIRLFHLGDELSPYLKTLKEIRTFTYEKNDFLKLSNYIKTNTFADSGEDSRSVVIHDAAIKITEEEGMVENKKTTDHLMRLFCYNDLMKKMGDGYFDKNTLAQTLIDQAQESHVVSPISSMIVLETQEDYDRFGIEKSKNSLENASFKSTGAIPEPHEWLLILLGGLLGFYLVWKRKNELVS